MEKEKKRRREEEIVEAALAAAAAALAISAMKKLFSLVMHRWPISLLSTPPHFLFVMLNLVIASILVFSVQVPSRKTERPRKKRRRDGSFANNLDAKKVKEKEEKEEEGEGDVEELNRRAEAFITAFRHQLRIDSFSSGAHRY
ncbi:hypothetical protein LUZ62_016485 [Rhynchospora pubera]|uniref:DUF4408 domain-containing protein n=1 Tax=Rhynchospora pubera TaxID=906938 RepID=A0AAV8GI50_9POAL|nr:hypothetical protein LUZ62_016485 [Rhynchospora pubera]